MKTPHNNAEVGVRIKTMEFFGAKNRKIITLINEQIS
nr:hypothetical protein [uncultured archaeon]